MNEISAFEFKDFSVEQMLKITSIREGEIKLGQTLQQNKWAAKYVILGISEDIGPQSNGGFPGSTTAFSAFVKRFLNIQSNSFLSGENIAILGEIVCNVHFENLAQGRNLVSELDDFVENILGPWIAKGKIPIVIGGGHNNAFPLIKTISKALDRPIQVINLDPHADFRPLEGRHSGNPFSYAFDQQYLDFYAIIGLHQNYNSQFMLDELKKNDFLFSFFDDYISGKSDFKQDLQIFSEVMHQREFGIELDMDSIAYMPSSAFSPSGMTLEQARNYITALAASLKVRYLHLPEAAPKNNAEETIVGKAMSYLVTDFLKANRNK